MKQCSYCGHQNEDGAVECSGCGMPLNPPPIKGGTADLKDPANAPVTVAKFQNLEEAELLKTELEAVGIEAYIPEEYTTGVFSSITPFQKVTVQVPAGNAEVARSIVAAFAATSRVTSAEEEDTRDAPAKPEPETEYSSGDNPPGQTRCVSCGAHIPIDSVLCPKCGWTQPRLA